MWVGLVTVGNWAYIKHSQKQIPSQLLLYSAAAWLVCCWLFILQHGHAGWFFFMGFWWMWCSVWFFFFFSFFFSFVWELLVDFILLPNAEQKINETHDIYYLVVEKLFILSEKLFLISFSEAVIGWWVLRTRSREAQEYVQCFLIWPGCRYFNGFNGLQSIISCWVVVRSYTTSSFIVVRAIFSNLGISYSVLIRISNLGISYFVFRDFLQYINPCFSSPWDDGERAALRGSRRSGNQSLIVFLNYW